MNIIITGGSGFIGTNFIKKIIQKKNVNLLNIDNLSKYRISSSLTKFDKTKYKFKKINICNYNLLKKVLEDFKPNVVVNFAAESHVDNSIKNPHDSIYTNIIGTYNLLEIIRSYLDKNNSIAKKFKFIHISTDEVYGSLKKNDKPFNENSPYRPNSPYSASKASSDHLVRSWYKTYKLPCIITHCTNNYGPFQYHEKLIPKTIKSCLENKPIPIFGTGKNIRDWIHVNDHVDFILKIIDKGDVGDVYNIGSNCEISNIALVKLICEYFDKILPKSKSYKNLIKYVKDRKGHDMRYAIDNSSIIKKFRIKPKIKVNEGMKLTVDWYMKNQDWLV